MASQSGADLSGRRLWACQWRHAVGRAGDIGDNSQQRRHLRHRARHAAASGNYALNYTGDNLTVTQRAITVTADAKSRAYGDANPALTYQVGGSGLANGDTLSGALATSATTASNVGIYGIAQGTLAASGNYALNYAADNLTVTQRAITVTADAKSRAYGDVNPALTYQVGGSGLVNGDALSGALATSATTASKSVSTVLTRERWPPPGTTR